MNAHKVETIVNENGQLILTGLPFKPGDTVEVIVLERPVPQPQTNPYPLQGTVLKYDDPFEPAVPPEEWEALQ